MTESEVKTEISTEINEGNNNTSTNSLENENISNKEENDLNITNSNEEKQIENQSNSNENKDENDDNKEITEDNQNLENQNQELNQNIENSNENQQNLDQQNEKQDKTNENGNSENNLDTNSNQQNKDSTSETQQEKSETQTAKSPSTPYEGDPLPEEQHPLQSEWTFYFFERPNSPEDWQESIHPIGTFSTCEMFWAYYSHIITPEQLYQDYAIHLFKEDYKAMWESENIKNGGYFTIRIKDTKQVQHYWEKLLLNMIGEQLGNDVIGAVLSKRIRSKNEEDLWYSIEIWLDFRVDDEDVKATHKFEMMRLLVDKLAIFGSLQFEFTDFQQFKTETKGRRKIEFYLYDGTVIKPIEAPTYNKQKRYRRQ